MPEEWEKITERIFGQFKNLTNILERLEAAHITHLGHCREDMNELYDRMRGVEAKTQLAEAYQKECQRQANSWPHWIHALAISLGTAIAVIGTLYGLGMRMLH